MGVFVGTGPIAGVTYDTAVIPGDGVGPAVTSTVLPLFRDAADACGFALRTAEYDWGGDRYRETGAMVPDDALERLAAHDAIMLGAVGHPEVPDHVRLCGLLLPVRKGFDQGIRKRPAVLYEGVGSPLRGYAGGDIDLVVYRENTEGEHSDAVGQRQPDKRAPSMFEPVHGSAPDIAGRGVVNPLAMVRSGAMLFDHLGGTAAADTPEAAVADQLADPGAPRTPDIGGDAVTEAVVDDPCHKI